MSKTIARRATVKNSYRVLGITAIGAATALTLSSCASGVPDPEEIWPDVTSSIEEATSVAIDGRMLQGDQNVDFTLSGQTDDSSYSGDVSMGEAEVQVLGNTEYTYMKPNAAFYEQLGGAALQDIVGEKWLEMPAPGSGFTLSFYLESITENVPSADDMKNAEFTSEAVDLDGAEVYKYTGANAASGGSVSFYVSKDNNLVRLELDGDAAESQGSDEGETSSAPATPSSDEANSGSRAVNFSQWDAVEPVEMPAEDEIFAVPGR